MSGDCGFTAFVELMLEIDAEPKDAFFLMVKISEAKSDRDIEKALDFANSVMGGFGVEVIRGDTWGRFWTDSVVVYVNMGDTYNSTLSYVPPEDKWYFGPSWGDVIEYHSYLLPELFPSDEE